MRILTLFSHELTKIQKKELADKYLGDIISLPNDLQKLFSQVPTAQQLPQLIDYILPILDFVNENTNKKDIVFVQGEFGITNLIVQWCFVNKRIPIYATTQRRAVEVHNDDGTVFMKHVFEHAGFREFEKI